MAKFGRFFWNNNDFIKAFTISESTEVQYLLPKSKYIIKFTMICVNLDIYTVIFI